MKKLLIILSLVLTPFMVQAENISVTLVNARNPIEGKILSFSDTLVIIEPKLAHGQSLEISPEKVKYLYIPSIGRYYSEDGKFVPDKKTQAKLEKTKITKIERELGVNNLNEEIAKAFKYSGGVCVGVGIASIIAGGALVGIGTSTAINDSNGNDAELIKQVRSKLICVGVGGALIPMGAGLTIAGIPLIVRGKRIAELNFNYTGNGAGVSVEF